MVFVFPVRLFELKTQHCAHDQVFRYYTFKDKNWLVDKMLISKNKNPKKKKWFFSFFKMKQMISKKTFAVVKIDIWCKLLLFFDCHLLKHFSFFVIFLKKKLHWKMDTFLIKYKNILSHSYQHSIEEIEGCRLPGRTPLYFQCFLR